MYWVTGFDSVLPNPNQSSSNSSKSSGLIRETIKMAVLRILALVIMVSYIMLNIIFIFNDVEDIESFISDIWVFFVMILPTTEGAVMTICCITNVVLIILSRSIFSAVKLRIYHLMVIIYLVPQVYVIFRSIAFFLSRNI